LNLIHKLKIEKTNLRIWLALSCILLVLVFFGLEATHVHASVASSGGARTPCVICISAHANAPMLAFDSLLALLTVAIVAVSYYAGRKGITRVSKIFIRPPPAV
jgi:hypothetical protein